MNPQLPPASQKLLQEIDRYDKGHGLLFRHAPRGRFYHPNTLATYNARTFHPLYHHGLVDDGGDDSAPLRITEAGRKLAAELAAASAAKKPRPKPSADGAAAMRLLREIAKHDKPVLIYNDGLRRVWRLGSRDGHRAAIDSWMALAKADLIRIESQFAGGQRVSVTDKGRKRLGQAAS